MTESWLDKTIIRLLSLLMALGLSAAILVFPNRLLMENGKSDHDLLMLLLVGICIGFIHGVGFAPKRTLWHFHMAIN